MSNVFARTARQARSLRRLPPNPECFFCGYRTPSGLKRVERRFFERHHIEYLLPDDREWIVVCLNCHAELTARQTETGAFPSRYRGDTDGGLWCFNRNMFELFDLVAECKLGPDAQRSRRIAIAAQVFDEPLKGLDATKQAGKLAELEALHHDIQEDCEAVPGKLTGVDFTSGIADGLERARLLRDDATALGESLQGLTDNPEVADALATIMRIATRCDRAMDLFVEMTRPELLAAAMDRAMDVAEDES